VTTSEALDPAAAPSGRRRVIATLGITQIFAWGSTYYLLAVLAEPIVAETGWRYGLVIGGVSTGLLVSGLVSVRVGRAIERFGGRPVLATSALTIAAGLVLLAIAPSIEVYFVAWLLLGIGMGGGLYDVAFSTLGRIYGSDARSAITALTLWGGFASTVCWPLSALLVEAVGWRGACLAYAFIHLAVTLPLHLLALPRERERPLLPRSGPGCAGDAPPARRTRLVFLLLAAILTSGGAIAAAIAIHLITMLQAAGLSLAAAVSLGALVGPAQVGARIVEMLAGRHYHDLDARRRRPPDHGGPCRPLARLSRPGPRADRLRRRQRHLVHCARCRAARPVRPQRLRHANGAARHAQPARAGRGALGGSPADDGARAGTDPRRAGGPCDGEPPRHRIPLDPVGRAPPSLNGSPGRDGLALGKGRTIARQFLSPFVRNFSILRPATTTAAGAFEPSPGPSGRPVSVADPGPKAYRRSGECVMSHCLDRRKLRATTNRCPTRISNK
jgi:MFS family permease